MKELRTLMEGLGADDVQTYIQSGNLIFRSDESDAAEWSVRIRDTVESQFGFSAPVLMLSVGDLQLALRGNPFASAEPKRMQFGFLEFAPVSPDLQKLDQLKTASEEYRIEGKVFYLHAPDGIGRSKLAAAAEKAIVAPMTVRNLNTVLKLAELANRS